MNLFINKHERRKTSKKRRFTVLLNLLSKYFNLFAKYNVKISHLVYKLYRCIFENIHTFNYFAGCRIIFYFLIVPWKPTGKNIIIICRYICSRLAMQWHGSRHATVEREPEWEWMHFAWNQCLCGAHLVQRRMDVCVRCLFKLQNKTTKVTLAEQFKFE